MAEFQEQQMFQGTAQSQGFAPMQAPDTSRFLRENMGTIDANFARMQSQQEQENERKLKEQQKLLETLGQFSETAMNFAMTQGKAFIDYSILRGHEKYRSFGKALNYGIKPEQQQAHDELRATADRELPQLASVAEELGKKKAPLEAINYIKSLGAYEQIGAWDEHLGQVKSYKGYISKFLQRDDINLPRPGGGTFKPIEAGRDSALMRIALAEGAKLFNTEVLGIGSDFNPSPVAMKPVYAEQDDVDAAFVQNADRNNQINTSLEKINKAQATWSVDRNYNNLLNNWRGRIDDKGNVLSRADVLDTLFDKFFVDAYAAGDKGILAELETQPVLDDNGDPTGQTWAERFKNRIEGVNGLKAKFADIDRRERLLRDEALKNKVDDYEQQWRAAQAEQRKSNIPFNEATVKSMREQAAVELGIPSESPLLNFFNDYTTKEGRDNQQDIDRLVALRRRRGYLIESDLSGVSDDVYLQMMKLVDEDASIAQRPKSYVSDNEKKITALTNDYFKVTDGEAPKTNEWEDMARRARNAEAQYYAEYIRAGFPAEEAQEKTRKRLEENFKAGTYTYDPQITPSVKYRRSLESARLTMANNPQIDSYVFAGSEDALAQLEKFDSGQTNQIPKLYHDIQLGNKNLSPYDVAAAQWFAKTGKVLRANPQQEAIMQHSAGYRRFMNYRPTDKKQLRANATSFRPGQTQQSGSPASLYKTNVVGTKSNYRGNSNVVSTGYTDYKGREVKFIPEAAADFKRMIAAMEADGVQFNPNYLTNVYRDEAEYMRLKNEGYTPASGGPHNHGLGFDCSSEGKDRVFNDWVRRRGGEFGFYPHDYHGTHGGHFEYTGVYR